MVSVWKLIFCFGHDMKRKQVSTTNKAINAMSKGKAK